MQKTSFILVAALLGLSACSTGSDIERAVVGGAAGCFVADMLEEGECLTGAAVGAAGGALADNF